MGATYFFLPETGLLVTTYWGRTEPAMTQRLREARAADPCRPLVRAHLIDLSRLEGTTATPHDEANVFRTAAFTYVQTYGPLPTAVIASAPHIYGEARIFEIVAGLQLPPAPIRVVVSWEEAARFLGLDLQQAQAEITRRQESSTP